MTNPKDPASGVICGDPRERAATHGEAAAAISSSTTSGAAPRQTPAAFDHDGKDIMTNPKDPASGVQLNEITVIRNRRLTQAEQAMADELMRCGTPRWLAAARLGTHPLNINRADNPAPRRARATGRLLSTTAASRDIRQLRMQGLD